MALETENCPSGNVIMHYDKKDEIWLYYADKKYKNNITFDELDTVCRKFCLTYNCTKLYIDRKENIKQQEREREEEEKEREEEKKLEEEKERDPDDDLFVKATVSTNKSVKSDKISAQKSNNYKYKGEINEFWAFNIKYEEKKPLENIGWSMWKKTIH